MFLDTTSKSLQLVLATAVTSNQLPCVVGWADITTYTFTPGSTDSTSNDTTPVTIVPSPASSTQRQIKSVTVYNADTAVATITVLYNNGTSTRKVVAIDLQPGETLQFAENAWSVVNSDGAILSSVVSTPTGSAGGDLSGTYPNPVVAKVNGIAVTGTPTSGQVLTATSGTAADWQTPSGGGGGSGTLAGDTDVNISSPTNNQVLTYNSTSSKWENQTSGSGVALDTTASDIQPLGTQAAGSTGKAADAGHVHPVPSLDQVDAPTADISLASKKITSLANGSAADDAAAFGQIPVAGTTSGTYAAGNDSRITGAVQSSTATAKGDILAATAASTIANVGVGSDGQVLTADSTQTAGVKWAAATGGAPSGTAGGDLGGTYPNPSVAKVNGISVTGTPTSGQALIATSGSAAAWSAINGPDLASTTNQQGQGLVLGASGALSWGYPWQFNVIGYGAVGDGTTDDTTAFQNAVNAACTYAGSNGGYAEVIVPPTSAYYAINGALQHGASTSGNAQITLPVVATTAAKITLVIRGVQNAGGIPQWTQTSAWSNGSKIVSNGTFASASAQTTSVNTYGNPCIIGGPSPQQGYGTSVLKYSNMLIVLQGIQLCSALQTSGWNYSAFDFTGLGQANIMDCAIGANTTYNATWSNAGNISTLAGGISIGGLLPAPGNNDNNIIRNLAVYGGYTYGIQLTEHTVVDRLQVLYCWCGVNAVGSYAGSVGALHAIYINQISCEGCNNHLRIVGTGASGYGPYIDISQWDGELSTFNIIDNTTGTGALDARGTINIVGKIPSGVNINGAAISATVKTGLKIYYSSSKPGAVTAPTAPATGVNLTNPFWRDAFVSITGGTITTVTVDGASLGSPTMFAVPSGRAVNIAYTGTLTWQWTLL